MVADSANELLAMLQSRSTFEPSPKRAAKAKLVSKTPDKTKSVPKPKASVFASAIASRNKGDKDPMASSTLFESRGSLGPSTATFGSATKPMPEASIQLRA